MIEEVVLGEEEVSALEKCTKQHALIAEQKQKYLSNQLKEDLYTAETATRSTSQHETIDSAADAEKADQTKIWNKIFIFN